MTIKERILDALTKMEKDYYGDVRSDLAKIRDNDNFWDDLEFMNMDIVDLTIALETEFGITVYNGDFQ